MERVAFLIQETGERIDCLLNPESVVMTRSAGVEARRSSGGRLTGLGLTDDPLLFTGGGRTELRLDLLFDIDLAPAHLSVTDVRQLTRPVWALAENSAETQRRRRPPLVLFLWGSAWSVSGIVTDVAERFDRFAEDGSPLRSWLRLTLVRTAVDQDAVEAPWELPRRLPAVDLTAPPVATLPVTGEGTDPGGQQPGTPDISPARLGLLAKVALGSELLWKHLLAYNDVDDPLQIPGTLDVPPVGESRP